MRVRVWPAGVSGDGCAEARLLQPARALAAQGADVTVDYTGPTVTFFGNPDWGDRKQPDASEEVRGCEKPDADVVVLQRPGRRFWAEIIPHLQAHGVKVVVDIDDRVDQIDPLNTAWADYQLSNVNHNYKWIALACKRADLVTTTTPELLKVYGFGHGVVLPNMIPERFLSITPKVDRRAIGWAGTVDTHPRDLQVTQGAVYRTLRDSDGWKFHHVGTGKDVREALGMPADMDVSVTGWVPFPHYPLKVAELGIGIVPLADTVFNSSKSNLKFSEMSALGVATVASPTPDNLRLHKLGVGLMASTPQKWYKHLRLLTTQDEARAELAGRGREVMAGQTIEGNCDRWWEAWTGSRVRQPKLARC